MRKASRSTIQWAHSRVFQACCLTSHQRASVSQWLVHTSSSHAIFQGNLYWHRQTTHTRQRREHAICPCQVSSNTSVNVKAALGPEISSKFEVIYGIDNADRSKLESIRSSFSLASLLRFIGGSGPPRSSSGRFRSSFPLHAIHGLFYEMRFVNV